MPDIQPHEVQKPSECVFFLAILGGMGYNPNLKLSPLLLIRCSISVVLIAMFILGCFTHAFGGDIPERKVISVQIFISITNLFVRHMNILLRVRFVGRILAEMDRLWEEMLSINIIPDEFVRIDKKIRKFMYLNLGIFLGPVPVAALTWLSNIGLPYDQVVDLLPCDTPFPRTWPHANLIVHLSYNIFSLLSDAVSIIIIFAISMYVGHFIKCLQEMLKAEGTDDNFGKRVFILHQEINRLLKSYNDLFAASSFFVVLVNSFEVAGRVFAIVTKSDEFATNVSYALLTLYTPFIVSYCGSYIQSENEKIFLQAYQNNWYRERLRRKKELYLMLTVASQPPTFRFRDLITFGMPQFTSFCQAVYSYVTVIKLFFK